MSTVHQITDELSKNAKLKETYLLENCVYKQVATLLESLEGFRQKHLYTDVVLCASEEEFPCHKVVLAASSRYFNVSWHLLIDLIICPLIFIHSNP